MTLNKTEGVREYPCPQSEQEGRFATIPEAERLHNSGSLHPYTRPLTISDLESVVALENEAFLDPSERATREKLMYRLSGCGELCLGIFCTVIPGSGQAVETQSTSRLVETRRKNGALSVLLGHVVASKTFDQLATDQSMDFSRSWNSGNPEVSGAGHQQGGRTIVLHSVAVLPQFQGRGIGHVLVKAYIQQMSGAGIADRLALIAHDHKVSWYEKHGFVNKGKSAVTFAGATWFDMVFDINAVEAAPYA